MQPSWPDSAGVSGLASGSLNGLLTPRGRAAGRTFISKARAFHCTPTGGTMATPGAGPAAKLSRPHIPA